MPSRPQRFEQAGDIAVVVTVLCGLVSGKQHWFLVPRYGWSGTSWAKGDSNFLTISFSFLQVRKAVLFTAMLLKHF